jgi:hypothetical protein
MGTMLRHGGLLLAVVAIALIGTSSAIAANGNGNGNGNGLLPDVTVCHKPTENGGKTMSVNFVALFGHLGHGDYPGACLAPPPPPVDEEEGEEQEPTCEELNTCEQPEEQPEDQPEETCEQLDTCEQPEEQPEEQSEESCEQQESCEQPEDEPAPTQQAIAFTPPAAPPSESRSLFCATKGWADRGNGDAPGVALNLPDGQGALLVAQGLATPAIFYAGVGVSCDLRPGFGYAGYWVDHVGDVVPGVAVYPYYVPNA